MTMKIITIWSYKSHDITKHVTKQKPDISDKEIKSLYSRKHDFQLINESVKKNKKSVKKCSVSTLKSEIKLIKLVLALL